MPTGVLLMETAFSAQVVSILNVHPANIAMVVLGLAPEVEAPVAQEEVTAKSVVALIGEMPTQNVEIPALLTATVSLESTVLQLTMTAKMVI